MIKAFHNLSVLIYKWSKVKTSFQSLISWVDFIRTLHFKVLSYRILVLISAFLIIDLFFCVNRVSVHWSRNLYLGVIKIVCGTYTNQTYRFSSPTVLWKVVTRVTVDCNCLLTSIDWFDWYKISFKFSTKYYFCWYLTCVYWSYWISANWYWSLSSGAIENLLWGVSKSYIQIWPPPQACKSSCRGCYFCRYTCNHQLIEWIQENHLKVLVKV